MKKRTNLVSDGRQICIRYLVKDRDIGIYTLAHELATGSIVECE